MHVHAMGRTHQGPGMKPQTARTGGGIVFYWPLLRVSSGLIEWAKEVQDLTITKKPFQDQRINALERPYMYKMVPKKSCQISILRTPIDWTWSRVYQIRSQIKKTFLFLSKLSPWGWKCR